MFRDSRKAKGQSDPIPRPMVGAQALSGRRLDLTDGAVQPRPKRCYGPLPKRGKGAAAKKLKYIGLTRGKAAGVRSNG